ncbi:glyoxalase-like domain protein [Pseudomonas sp. Leaf127]|uniref:VOC family protein n=1 Tax=Pseudomonas sp. Leaf127 TaxID=1736267 RepID=UPI0007025EB0|nr:VOC family protein [Pseudomonas sp. Leaf127]KQQ62414.1 glyoxalase-like domain protein [Pseudomonas sp. Leaf127]MBD8496153.1 VOC family protein [Pseudomonas syringae]
MEIDHIFVCVKDENHGAEALKSLGLVEGTPNVHPGQGTANRRFFLRNAFIELLYLTDESEAQSDLTAPTRLFERLTCAEGAAAPFGICFRPSIAGEKPMFPVWAYRPVYLPAALSVDVGHAPVSEPMWFFLSFAKRPDEAPRERAQPLEHPNGFRDITFVRVTTPSRQVFSTAANCANQLKGFEMVQGDEHLIELEIDHGASAQTIDLRPELPMIING